MKKTLRMTALVGLMSMILGLMALPAAAYDIVIFAGEAVVCADSPAEAKPSASGCPIKEGENNGLYLVGQPGGPNVGPGVRIDPTDDSKWANRAGNYRFSDTIECRKFNPLAPGDYTVPPHTCDISVGGKLGPVIIEDVNTGIGAACGISRGYDGTGFITSSNGGEADVSDVGWVTSAGGTLPIQGTYTVRPGTAKTKIAPDVKPATGPIVGLVQAQGGQFCVKLPAVAGQTGKQGASTFRVVGVVAMQ